MAKRQGGLGRDFYSILSDNYSETSNSLGEMIRISSIEPRKDQPRKDFDEDSLATLSESIKQYGVLQPIIVRETSLGNGYYEIVAGERRWRAARMAGLSTIPAIVLEGDDRKAAEIALIENIQREGLNPVEEAFAYSELISNYGLTQEQLSSQIGKSRSAIANMLRLLDLPESVLSLLRDGVITAGHARALLGLYDESEILPLAERTAEQELSVREVESLVKRINSIKKLDDGEAPPRPMDQRTYYIKDLERRAGDRLGRRVRIAHTGRKKTIELSFNDDEDLETLITCLCGKDFFDDKDA